MTRRARKLLFPALAVVIGIAAGLALTEVGLRYYAGYVQSQEQMDPGFLVYDSRLGWKMAANWSGRHRHYDFDVRYTTNADGLRNPWPEPVSGERRVAFLGDSFTFGLGVNDDETFVARLNEADPSTVYLNAGVAGYSTDQQLLLLQDRLASWNVDEVVLVVYLANDLLDNMLRYPLQAEMGKPAFRLTDGRLILENVPVPLSPKPPEERARTLASTILGPEEAEVFQNSWRSRWRWAQMLGMEATPSSERIAEIHERLQAPLQAFEALLGEVHRLCQSHDVSLRLALMPGRSYVESPEGLSAAFQEVLRAAILKSTKEVPVMDLASRLRAEREKGKAGLFHPNEGHLTAAGHREMADIFAALRIVGGQ